MAIELWHLTCRHMAGKIILDGLVVKPHPQLLFGEHSEIAWFTHLPNSPREALGLTSHTLNCDRTERRFRVVDAKAIFRWNDIRAVMPRELIEQLEAPKGTRPELWWMSAEPVQVEQVMADAHR